MDGFRKRNSVYYRGDGIGGIGNGKGYDKNAEKKICKAAKACYKLNQLVLVNLDIVDEYLESFRITDDDFYK